MQPVTNLISPTFFFCLLYYFVAITPDIDHVCSTFRPLAVSLLGFFESRSACFFFSAHRRLGAFPSDMKFLQPPSPP